MNDRGGENVHHDSDYAGDNASYDDERPVHYGETSTLKRGIVFNSNTRHPLTQDRFQQGSQ
jgi:hypothetical protein